MTKKSLSAIKRFSTLKSYLSRKNKAAIRFLKKRRYPTPSFRHDPLVSVLIVTHNSQRHLSDLFNSLAQQSYSSFEVIFVDNASSDGTIEGINELINHAIFPVKVIESDFNHGFAAGCNLALDKSDGELIALLNTDATPEKDWLLELVHALRLNPWAAVATPKVLFNGYFIRIKLFFPYPVRLDLSALIQSLSYPKIFIRSGIQEGLESVRSNPHGCISFDLPFDTKALNLLIQPVTEAEFLLPNTPYPVEQSSPQLRIESEASTNYISIPWRCWIGDQQLTIPIPNDSPRFRLINNAGSTSGRISDQPKDRGFANIDCSYYDHPIRTSRFCGCAPMLRREAIIDRTLFVKQFFAYYEDSELGRWLIQNKRGETIYWPRSIVNHYHSSTLGEKSPTWTYLTQRSWLLYHQLGLPAHQPSTAELQDINHRLLHLAETAKLKSVDNCLIDYLQKQDQDFLIEIHAGKNRLMSLGRKAIGIFNLYWNTRGGGESHALALAASLRQQYPDADIYLLSETDFDLDSLGQYFNIDVTGFRKLTTSKVTKNLTKRFWLFINSTSHSSLLSLAEHSWYIVSFPHHVVSRSWLKGYKLLCNSKYTQEHCKLRWGSQQSEVVYPVLHFKSKDMISAAAVEQKKQAFIIGVGRFTRRGHAKNQHHIISAFDKVCKSEPAIDTYWQLLLIGSLETSNYEDCCYFNDLQEQISNSPFGNRIQLITNAPRNELDKALDHALIYIHATGLKAPASKPEMQEHFGIAPVEAALRGCIPLVYHLAGPAEVIHQTGCGHPFNDEVDLAKQLGLLMEQPLPQLRRQAVQTAQASQRWVCQHQNIPFDRLL